MKYPSVNCQMKKKITTKLISCTDLFFGPFVHWSTLPYQFLIDSGAHIAQRKPNIARICNENWSIVSAFVIQQLLFILNFSRDIDFAPYRTPFKARQKFLWFYNSKKLSSPEPKISKAHIYKKNKLFLIQNFK